jgi:hypothetical protein
VAEFVVDPDELELATEAAVDEPIDDVVMMEFP